jgi:putative ubiquitin-RnfH superfamily antitoxin RatB of RatAB toxin-antitoxin module
MYYVEMTYFHNGEGLIFGLKTQLKTVLSLCQYMGLDCDDVKVGIDGEIVNWDTMIDKDCRIELYPKLRIDPKLRRKRLVEARRKK